MTAFLAIVVATAGLVITPASATVPGVAPSLADDFNRANGTLGNGWSSAGYPFAPAIADQKVVAPNGSSQPHGAVRAIAPAVNRFELELASTGLQNAQAGVLLDLDAQGNGHAIRLQANPGSGRIGYRDLYYLRVTGWTTFGVIASSTIDGGLNGGRMAVVRGDEKITVTLTGPGGATTINLDRSPLVPTDTSTAGIELSGGAGIDGVAFGTATDVAFTSPPPDEVYVGDTFNVAATSSTTPPTFTSLTPSACTVTGTTVTAKTAATCIIQAIESVGGATDTQTFPIALVPVTLDLTAPYLWTLLDTVEISLGATGPRGVPQGTVTIKQGAQTLVPATAVTGSRVTISRQVVLTDSGKLTATFTPNDPGKYAVATASKDALIMRQSTETRVRLDRDGVHVEVVPVAPEAGGGTPSGDVRLMVNSNDTDARHATLVDGKATFSIARSPGDELAVSYLGDTYYFNSVAFKTQSRPVITAQPARPAVNGWYRDPVTVSFTCTAGSSPISDACPAPVTKSEEGENLEISRSITADDGSTVTTHATVSIDRAAPTVAISGLPADGTYDGTAPVGSCVAADALSLVDTCELSRLVADNGTATYTATATDKAGNASTYVRTLRRLAPPTTPTTPKPPTLLVPGTLTHGGVTLRGGIVLGRTTVGVRPGVKVTVTIKAKNRPKITKVPKGFKVTKFRKAGKASKRTWKWKAVLTLRSTATRTSTVKFKFAGKTRKFTVKRLV